MKTTNEEKARRLCCSDCKNYVCYTNKKRCQALEDILTMADWKDEQHKQEKQQWIDKAADFISKRFYIGINNQVTSKENYYTLTELIRDFEQTMKGE